MSTTTTREWEKVSARKEAEQEGGLSGHPFYGSCVGEVTGGMRWT